MSLKAKGKFYFESNKTKVCMCVCVCMHACMHVLLCERERGGEREKEEVQFQKDYPGSNVKKDSYVQP